jgi:MYXO-CTERM domain-containing protein
MRRGRLLLAALIGLSLPAVSVVPAYADTVTPAYSYLPNPLPPSVVSQPFEAQQTSEFGDEVELAGSGDQTISQVTITLEDWALHSDSPTWPTVTPPTPWPNYPITPGGPASTTGDADTAWVEPITLNLYNIDHSTSTPEPGTMITSVTQSFDIPFKPAGDPTCPTSDGSLEWRSPVDAACHTGYAFNITFDLSNLVSGPVVVPSDVGFGIVYNTEDYGPSPYHAPGPYDSLNVGLNTTTNTSGYTATTPLAPTVGTDPNPDDVFWNTATASDYSLDDPATPSTGLRDDVGWAPFQPAIEFDVAAPQSALPETPLSIALPGAALLILGLAWLWRRRRRGAHVSRVA